MRNFNPNTCQGSPDGRLRVPFGLATKDGRIYSPIEVESGKKCGCICPACKKPLIAKLPRNSNRVPHFAHEADAACANGFETAVHLAAKQLIAEKRALYFPEAKASLVVDDDLGKRHSHNKTIAPAETRRLTSILIEHTIQNVRPDLIVTCDSGHEICVEIAVTHFIDADKLEKLHQLPYPTLEFDLSGDREFTWDSLHAALIEGQAPCNWKFHPQIEDQIKLWRSGLASTLENARIKALERQKAFAERQAKEQEKYRHLERIDRQQAAANERLQRKKRRSELEKAQAFKTASPLEKISLICRSFHRHSMPRSIRVSVPGEKSFGVPDPLIWQAALFRGVIHRAAEKGHKQVNKEFALAWLSYRFDIKPAFPDAPDIAVWKYLSGLAEQGALRRGYRQSFSILVADLAAFETLNSYRAGKINVGDGLTWASPNAWPTKNATLIIASNYATMSLVPSYWEAAATLIPNVTNYPIEEIISNYSKQINKEHLINYWISAGFLVSS